MQSEIKKLHSKLQKEFEKYSDENFEKILSLIYQSEEAIYLIEEEIGFEDYSEADISEIEKECHELEKFLKEVKKKVGPTNIDELADFIHSIFCHKNHIDECDYFNGKFRNTKYWRMANRITEINDLFLLVKVFKIMQEENI